MTDSLPIGRQPAQIAEPDINPARASLHGRILADIRDLVLSGKWTPGFRIPIETDLAAQYDCSRMTVNKALSQLVRDGFIERRKKVGSFVLAPRARSAVLEIRDIKDDVQALGLPYRFERLSRSVRYSNAAERRRLGLATRSTIMAVRSLHFAGKVPYCYEDRIINMQEVPTAADEAFKDVAPGEWLNAHILWTDAEHRIRATHPDAASARALTLDDHKACLVVERTTRRSGAPITHVVFVYPGHMRELVARFTPSQS